MAVYADYAFYSTSFLGTAIESSNFPRLALRASRIIDQVTFGRANSVITENTDADTIELIKMATCAVAEEMFAEEQSGNLDGVTSERVGSYSVTFGAGSKNAMSNEEKQERAARLYLGFTGLMFKGFTDEE
jgi:hypothetical protein